MVKRAFQLDDADLAAVLDEALCAGALSLADASKYLRAREGLTQIQFGERVGVATKVIKAIESGQGNPTLESLNRIAESMGLQVGFFEKRPTVRLGGVHTHFQQQSIERHKELSAIESNRRTLLERHSTNALSGADFTIDLPSIE